MNLNVKDKLNDKDNNGKRPKFKPVKNRESYLRLHPRNTDVKIRKSII